MLSARDSTSSVVRLTPRSDLFRVVLQHTHRTSTPSSNIDVNAYNSFSKNKPASKKAKSKFRMTRTSLVSRNCYLVRKVNKVC